MLSARSFGLELDLVSPKISTEESGPRLLSQCYHAMVPTLAVSMDKLQENLQENALLLQISLSQNSFSLFLRCHHCAYKVYLQELKIYKSVSSNEGIAVR